MKIFHRSRSAIAASTAQALTMAFDLFAHDIQWVGGSLRSDPQSRSDADACATTARLDEKRATSRLMARLIEGTWNRQILRHALRLRYLLLRYSAGIQYAKAR